MPDSQNVRKAFNFVANKNLWLCIGFSWHSLSNTLSFSGCELNSHTNSKAKHDRSSLWGGGPSKDVNIRRWEPHIPILLNVAYSFKIQLEYTTVGKPFLIPCVPCYPVLCKLQLLVCVSVTLVSWMNRKDTKVKIFVLSVWLMQPLKVWLRNAKIFCHRLRTIWAGNMHIPLNI